MGRMSSNKNVDIDLESFPLDPDSRTKAITSKGSGRQHGSASRLRLIQEDHAQSVEGQWAV
jgi:hypothetical protein